MHRTPTGIVIGSAHQRRHTPSSEELRMQQALLGDRRRAGLLRRALAAAGLCYELTCIVAICGAVALAYTLKGFFNV